MKHKHSLSKYRLSTLDMGQLYPIGLWEILPTDIVQANTSVMLRLLPLAAPVMHPIDVRVHWFFVPHRLTWSKELGDESDWETFITGGKDGMDASTPPTIQTTGERNDLLEALGLPRVAGIDVNAMAVRAFNMTFNEWYRDQDLVPERELDDTTIPHIAWERDYFTQARSETQKGPAVTVPLGSAAPVFGNGLPAHGHTADGIDRPISVGTVSSTQVMAGQWPSGEFRWAEDESTGLIAQLSEATGITVNELRRSLAIQRFQEARLQYGSRYTEYLQHSFGARPLDARMQRPEFVAGGRAKVSISEVLQTAPEINGDREFGVGDMYGHGIAGLRSRSFRKQFQEHGYLMSMLSVRPRTLYQQGVERHWLKVDKEDYFQRELAHIGQQDVKMNELYADPLNTAEDVFGYADRYREYRRLPNEVTGDFRDLFDFWHLGRKFDQAPALNQAFIECNPSKRIFNVQTGDSMLVAAQHRVVARRPVPTSVVGKVL